MFNVSHRQRAYLPRTVTLAAMLGSNVHDPTQPMSGLGWFGQTLDNYGSIGFEREGLGLFGNRLECLERYGKVRRFYTHDELMMNRY